MATNPKLKSYGGPILKMEQQTSKFGSASTLVGASFTIPSGAHEIHCMPSGPIHWTPNGVATTSFMHPVAANELFVLTHAQHLASIISDSGSITMTVAYLK